MTGRVLVMIGARSGDKVFILHRSYAEPAIVSSVGRKWLYVAGEKFDRKTGLSECGNQTVYTLAGLARYRVLTHLRQELELHIYSLAAYKIALALDLDYAALVRKEELDILRMAE